MKSETNSTPNSALPKKTWRRLKSLKSSDIVIGIPSYNCAHTINYVIYQTASDINYIIPDGTFVNPGGYIIIARDSNKESFEIFWGINLSSDVIFINGDNNFPSINGDETFELQDNNSNVLDGPTGLPMDSYNTVQRLHSTYDPTLPESWSISSDIYATPGSGAFGDETAGLIINEYSDASGTGNWRYEFIELYYDAPVI